MTELLPLPHHPDTAARFERLRALPGAVLLDSCGGRARGGRWDIVAVLPRTTIRSAGGLTLVTQRGASAVATREDPFAVIDRLRAADARTAPPGVPFAGGAIGYWAYDLGRRLEAVPDRVADDVPLPEMVVGLYDHCLLVDHLEGRTWLATPDAGAEAARRLADAARAAPCATPAAWGPDFLVTTRVAPDIDREAYHRAFARVHHYLREGDCYQVNLTQRFSACYVGDPWAAYRRLRHINPAPHSAFISLPEGCILSSSPERFLAVREGEVETRPIKGTRRRLADAAADAAVLEELAASEKDRAENVMIVDLLRNDLGRSCAPGSIRVPRLFETESYATVHHLVSTVVGRLRPGCSALDLLRGCFPGGSITGAPKRRAMQIIEELEPVHRSVYCGAIGYVGWDGAMDTSIAIRTLVCSQGRMHCWAGGGIVLDSDVEAEYQESLDKAAAMLQVFERSEAVRVDAEARR